MKTKVTNDGRGGGLLKGPTDENGGEGIPAVVAATGQPIILGGDEVIINRKAAKKHWKKLDEINQSTGGAPISRPVGAKAAAGGSVGGTGLIQVGDIVRGEWQQGIKVNFRVTNYITTTKKLSLINLLTREDLLGDAADFKLYMTVGGVVIDNGLTPDFQSGKSTSPNLSTNPRASRQQAKIDARAVKAGAKTQLAARRRATSGSEAEEPDMADAVDTGDASTKEFTGFDTHKALNLFLQNKKFSHVTELTAIDIIKKNTQDFILDVEFVDQNKTINLNPYATVAENANGYLPTHTK